MNLEQALNQGIKHHEAGRLAEAERIYREVLAIQPNSATAIYLLGVVASDCDQYSAAIELIRRAIALNPNVAEYHSRLGDALARNQELDRAIDAYRTAIRLKPDFAVAYNNLGHVHELRQEWDQAIANYHAAIKLAPTYLLGYHNLGNTLYSCRKFDEATEVHRAALKIAPDSVEAHNDLGLVLKAVGRIDEAIISFRRAIALRPDLAELQSNLACTLYCSSDATPQSIHNEHRLWNQRHGEPLKQFIQPHLNDRNPDRRLRIGYVSPDFRSHPISKFLIPLLENHDRTRVEVFCYSDVLRPDPITKQFVSYADTWRSIAELPHERVAEVIREDRIDILVDLNMHLSRNRLLTFARKPAPVQVTYLAYCGTTGLDTIDYRISDPYLDPPGSDESIYSEKTVRMPNCFWCYKPDEIAPQVNPLPARASGSITFGCLNDFIKVSPNTISTWSRLLHAVPGSRLMLHAKNGRHRHGLFETLSKLDIDPQRLHFVDFVPLLEYLGQYHQIDIALDPFPYNGGTTSCDALWMGVPVISLVGDRAMGRAGASILSNIGLTELVAPTENDYVKIATDLAGDLPRLGDLRATLRTRMQASPLLDAPRFARDMEQAFRQMWRQWCSGDKLEPR